MKAIILAAGYGKRLQPLTKYIPKALVPILGKPALAHVFNRLLPFNAQQIGINLHYQSEKIITFLQSQWMPHLNIKISLEEEILGTGGAIFNFRDFLRKNENFILYNSDIISDINLSAAYQQHCQRKALATLILWDYPPINTVLVDENERILQFFSNNEQQQQQQRHSKKPGNLLTFTGISIINSKILDYIPEGYCEMPHIYQNIIKTRAGNILGIKGRGHYWTDFGTPSKYLNTHLMLMKRADPKEKFLSEGLIYKHGGIKISDSVHLEGFISLGNRSIIGDNVFLKDCVVWPETRVKSGTFAQRAILSNYFIHMEDNG